MATEVKITSAPQQIAQLSTATVATVQVGFEIIGILPDEVQVYASQVTTAIGQLVDTVDINSPEFQYMDTWTKYNSRRAAFLRSVFVQEQKRMAR